MAPLLEPSAPGTVHLDGTPGDGVGEEVLAVDRALAALEGELDVLLDVGPTNAAQQWQRWQDGRNEPEFRYRELTSDPAEVQREAASMDLEAVEHQGLRQLYADALRWIELEAQLVLDRCTDRFLATSVELHGGCDDELYELARELLDRLEPAPAHVELVEPARYVELAELEIEHYREVLGDHVGTVRLRDDVSSLMVVGREHLVGTDSWIPIERAEALVHHEVGAHLYTAVTGGFQPLRIFEHGTAGYGETQEALGVLSELMSGGLDDERMRVLAARAIAVRWLTEGAEFADVVAGLVDRGVAERAAWTVAMRVFRGGGYTKDVIYLRGLVELVAHLADHPIDPLLVGRVHLRDVELVGSLLERGVLVAPVAPPRWLGLQGAVQRLDEAIQSPPWRWSRLRTNVQG